MILNLNQNDEIARGLLVKAFLEDVQNKAVYSIFYPFDRAAKSFLSNLGLLQTEAVNKAKKSPGTRTKEQLKKAVAKNFGQVLSHTIDFATQKNNTKLLDQVNFSETYIYRVKDPELLTFVTDLQKNVFTTALLSDPDFVKYEITAETIQDIVDDAIAFNKKIGDNKLDDKESSVANDAMNKIILDMHADITSMSRNVGKFSDNPDFVNGYYKCIVPIKTGIHHQGKKGFVYKNGVKQPGSAVHIIGTDKSTVADADAYYELIGIQVGKYKMQASNEAGDSQILDIEIHRRKIDNQDFNLE